MIKRSALLIIGIVLSMGSRAQCTLDSVIFNLVNQYLLKHSDTPLAWSKDLYNEAKDNNAYQNADSLRVGDDTAEDKEISIYAGIYGEYISEAIQFDGELDSTTYSLIDSLFFDEIVNSPEILQFITKTRERFGACSSEVKVIYMENPAKNSIIKQFSIWLIYMTVAVSY